MKNYKRDPESRGEMGVKKKIEIAMRIALKVGLDYRQSCSGNKNVFRAYCHSSSGNKREKILIARAEVD